MPSYKDYRGTPRSIPLPGVMPRSLFNDLNPAQKARVLHFGELEWRCIHLDGETLRGFPPGECIFADVPPEVPPPLRWQHPKGLGFRGGVVRHILALDDDARIPTAADQVRPEPSEAGTNQVRPEDEDREIRHRNRSIHHAIYPASLYQIVGRTVRPIYRLQRQVIELVERWWKEQPEMQEKLYGRDRDTYIGVVVQHAVEALEAERESKKRRYRPFDLTGVLLPDGSVDVFEDDQCTKRVAFIPAGLPGTPKPGEDTVRISGVKRPLVWASKKNEEKIDS
jgi:hypothetical protein